MKLLLSHVNILSLFVTSLQPSSPIKIIGSPVAQILIVIVEVNISVHSLGMSPKIIIFPLTKSVGFFHLLQISDHYNFFIMWVKIRRKFGGFKLTEFAKVKGWNCKIKKPELLSYLNAIPKTKSQVFSVSPDCYIKSIKGTNLSVISSVDFFYPLVDDPYTQGQLTVANVLSDLYAMGVTNIDHYLAILGVSD